MHENHAYERDDVCVVDEFVLAYSNNYTLTPLSWQVVSLAHRRLILLGILIFHRFPSFLHRFIDESVLCGYVVVIKLSIPQSFRGCGKLVNSLY